MMNVEEIPNIDDHIYSFEELVEVSSKEDNIPIFMNWDEEETVISSDEEPDVSELLSLLEELDEEEEPDLSELLALMEEE